MKILLISILSALILSASNINKHQVKIIEKIFSEISINEKLRIWSNNEHILSKIKDNGVFNTTNNCRDSNIIILENTDKVEKVCLNKYIFVLNYQLLSDLKDSFGAMFWKKGRPNIVIVEPRIKAQSITISKDLEPYLEEKVW